MRRASFRDMNCSIAQTLEVIGDPWTMLVVRDLMFGLHRFNDIQASLGIPRNTLTARLDMLVAEGIAHKVAYQTNPERFDYHLTTKGRDLSSVIVTMMKWGDRWSRLAEPPVHLVEDATGRRLDPHLVDRLTGTPLEEIRYRPIGENVPPRPAAGCGGSATVRKTRFSG